MRAFHGVYEDDYLGNSLYFRQMQSVLDNFSRDHVLVLFDFEVYSDPQRELGRVLEFVGVDVQFKPSTLCRRINSSADKQIDPFAFWAKINQIEQCIGRVIEGKNFGRARMKGPLSVLLWSPVAKLAVKGINRVLERRTGKRAVYQPPFHPIASISLREVFSG